MLFANKYARKRLNNNILLTIVDTEPYDIKAAVLRFLWLDNS